VIQYIECLESEIQIEIIEEREDAGNLGIVLKVNWASERVSAYVALGSRNGVQDEGSLIQIRPVSIDRSGMVREYLRVFERIDTGYQVGTVTSVASEGFILIFCDGEWCAANEANQGSKLPIVHDITSDAVDWKLALENEIDVEIVRNVEGAGTVIQLWIVGI